jgi:hypothetical protein
MSDDYFEQCKRSLINRGRDTSPESMARDFGSHDHEHRAKILDWFDGEKDNSPLTAERAAEALERDRTVGLFRRVHATLRKYDR